MATAGTDSGARAAPHKWRFFRSGGFDQVRMETAADFLALPELDQKLWAALSCPTRGVEFDSKALSLLDLDGDGRIRAPEVIAAVEWVCSVLKDAQDLTKGASALPLAAIRDDTDEGRQLRASAEQILANLGKAGAQEITLEDTADTAKIFATTHFNGDGIVPAEATGDETIRAVIQDIIDCFGAETDRSGLPGISEAKAEQFFTEAEAYAAWWQTAQSDAANLLPLGEATGAAAMSFAAVKSKVDDYFTRCRLAEFDLRAAEPLNRTVAEYEALAAKQLSPLAEEVAAFPLAHIEASRPLPLKKGVNPAWGEAMAKFAAEVVVPVYGARDSLTAEEWANLSAKFAGYESWLASKPETTIEKLGRERIEEVLGNDSRASIAALIAQDKALESTANAIDSVDKLVRYHHHLFQLLNNFVSFRDFYTPGKKGIFQAGTLYLDGRSCELCVRVEDASKHSALANLSRTYLAYCDCARRGSDEKMTIAAAFTDGDSDNLMVGRNGIFYDRQGHDWDATIVKILEHPIGVRQAFWAPYKRIGKLIAEQAEKFATARDKAAGDKAAAGIAEAGKSAETGKPTPPPAFDVAKFAGIFAAIGLAIGAIGTAIAAVLTGFLSLQWWQMPLAIVGLVLVISGPSMMIAALKLRKRNLAPILDANGWAVNTQAKMNIKFGEALTAVAKLPPGAQRSLKDPYAEKKQPWRFYLVLVVLLAALAYLWQQGYIEKWWTKYAPKPPAPVTETAPAPAPAPTTAPAETAKPQ